MKKIDRPPNEELINDIAEIVAEIWRRGKDYSQVFDFHECSSRERWVARLFKLYEGKLEELLGKVQPDIDIYHRMELFWYEPETQQILADMFDGEEEVSALTDRLFKVMRPYFVEQARQEVLKEALNVFKNAYANHPADAPAIVLRYLKSGTMKEKE